jgi:hypothetical protein
MHVQVYLRKYMQVGRKCSLMQNMVPGVRVPGSQSYICDCCSSGSYAV